MKNEKYIKNLHSYNKLLSLYEKRFDGNCYGTPLIMSFLVTNRCNLKCKHCFYHESLNSGDNNNELCLSEYEKISKSMGWFLTGIFCGGEPFVRDDFADIIYLFQKNNHLATADSASNGQLTDQTVHQVEKILKKSRYQKYSLGISLEGREDINDEIRGKGSFKHALETWKELKKLQEKYSNFEPYICTTINAVNQNDMYDFLKWCMENLQTEKISLLKIRQNPRDGDYLKNVTPENYKNCIDYIQEQTRLGMMGDINKPQTFLLCSCYKYIYNSMIEGKRLFKCYAGRHGGFVDYNGDVGFCEIQHPIGNLRAFNYDFLQLWNSQESMMARNNVCISQLCSECTHESEGLLPSINFEPNKILV